MPADLGLVAGMRVGVPGRASQPCADCFECTNNGSGPRGCSPYCPRASNNGLTRDGGFQEYCIVDGRQVAPLPADVPSTQTASLSCAGLTVWAALHHPGLQQQRAVATLGAGGGLGHLGVQFAAHLGFEVIAIDANDKSIELLHHVRESLPESVRGRVRIADVRHDTADNIKAMLSGPDPNPVPDEAGVEAVIMLPDSQAAFGTGMHILQNHGTMIVVSFHKEKLQVSAHDLVFRDINVVGSLVGRNHRTYPLGEIDRLVADSHAACGKLVDMLVGK